jgi:hypothetical protein
MTSITPKTKALAATMTTLVALTGAALARGAVRVEPTTDLSLGAPVVQLGAALGYWTNDCPLTLGSATAWAEGYTAESNALASEGFALGVREQFRSRWGNAASGLAIRFRTPAGAKADLERRELAAGQAGYATNFAVPGAPPVHAYTVHGGSWTSVNVGYTRGSDEYVFTIDAPRTADISSLQRTVATAITRVAGGR